MSDDRRPESAGELVRTRGYLRLLALAGLVGVPVSLAAFGFLALLHELTHVVWQALPDELGYDVPPWWWAAPWLVVAGVLVGAAIRFLPGRGGHVPIDGLGADPVPPSHLPGIILAALGGLPLGAVLGPEAPLIATGSALAILLTRRWGQEPGTSAYALIGVAGATAAIAVVFGSPLVAGLFILEAVGLAGPRLARAILPCLLASGVGALVFTGLGGWTGFEIASLSLPELSGPARPDVADLLWTVPVAVAIAFAVRQVHRIGHWVAPRAAGRPMIGSIAVTLLIAACAGAYSIVTDRSPVEVALSGQQTLTSLATDPHGWSVGALVALLMLKGIAYGASLGALRGGPVFPALFLGAAAGVLLSGLPGFGVVPAMAAGMAAATAAILPLPIASAVLVTLLLGTSAPGMTPIVLIAVVVAFVSEQIVERSRPGAEIDEPGQAEGRP